jgi:Protein of unknown function (DUF1203)
MSLGNREINTSPSATTIEIETRMIRIASRRQRDELAHSLYCELVMPSFIVRPIGRDITAAVRTTLRAPQYGHPVHRELARGTGPCRECLSAFDVEREERLLFTYNPHDDADLTPQPGPVFIHAEPCEPFTSDAYPGGLKTIPVLAEAHYLDATRSAANRLEQGGESAMLEAMLADDRVRCLHLRHAEAGCFIARVDRTISSTSS